VVEQAVDLNSNYPCLFFLWPVYSVL
jgi:hypothetical protein